MTSALDSGHAFQKDEDPSKPSVEDDKMEECKRSQLHLHISTQHTFLSDIVPLDAVSNKTKVIDEEYIILDKVSILFQLTAIN